MGYPQLPPAFFFHQAASGIAHGFPAGLSSFYPVASFHFFNTNNFVGEVIFVFAGREPIHPFSAHEARRRNGGWKKPIIHHKNDLNGCYHYRNQSGCGYSGD